MYKRNVRGNLYHPGGTAQDVSTLKLCSIATGEIQLCVVQLMHVQHSEASL